MNSKQQLLALQADFGALPVSDVIALLQFLHEKEIFSRLSGISVLVKITDPLLIPADIDTRLPLERILLCVPVKAAEDKEVQTRLKYFSSHGARIVVDDLQTHDHAIWEGAKKISVDCSKDIPGHVKPLLLRLHGGNHLAQHLPHAALQEQANEAGFKWFSG
ncbi:MAG: hypothetical protein HYR68_12980, partial [Burkholderiales bacterium]|nr:hypothetical protein [Burkholderiales bacterium]